MPVYISLLRAINVGGHHKMAMKDLQDLYSSLAFKKIISHIQSGNLAFISAELPIQTIQQLIEQAILEKFGFSICVLVYPLEEFLIILEKGSQLHFSEPNPSKVYLSFMDQLPNPVHLQNLADAIPIPFIVEGQTLYQHCPQGYSNSPLNNQVIEKKLMLKSTTRNLKTCQDIVKKANGILD